MLNLESRGIGRIMRLKTLHLTFGSILEFGEQYGTGIVTHSRLFISISQTYLLIYATHSPLKVNFVHIFWKNYSLQNNYFSNITTCNHFL